MKNNLWSINWYSWLTSLVLGGSASGTTFFSLKLLEEAFSSFTGKVPGAETRQDF